MWVCMLLLDIARWTFVRRRTCLYLNFDIFNFDCGICLFNKCLYYCLCLCRWFYKL